MRLSKPASGTFPFIKKTLPGCRAQVMYVSTQPPQNFTSPVCSFSSHPHGGELGGICGLHGVVVGLDGVGAPGGSKPDWLHFDDVENPASKDWTDPDDSLRMLPISYKNSNYFALCNVFEKSLQSLCNVFEKSLQSLFKC